MIWLYVLAGIWLASPVISWLYILILLPRDIRFADWRTWYAVEFKLISKESWYAKLWADWTGCSVWGAIIMREPNETVRIHELNHCFWRIMLGGFFDLSYGLHFLWIMFFQKNKHPYYDCIWERLARRAAGQLVDIPKEKWPSARKDTWYLW